MPAKQDKAYKERLAEWRQKHFEQMKTNMKVAIEIRDDSTAKAKDRIDAIKTIARMLGTLAPEKIEKKEAQKTKESPFTPAEEKKIKAKITSVLGQSWIESSEKP